MLSIFFIDWIVDYINTPQIEITAGQEALFYAAIAIIFLIIGTPVFTIACIIEKRLKHGNRK